MVRTFDFGSKGHYSASWVLRDTIELEQALATPSHLLIGEPVQEEFDLHVHLAVLYIQLDNDVIRYELYDDSDLDDAPKSAFNECSYIDLSMSYYFQGRFETLTLSGKDINFAINQSGRGGRTCQWMFDRTSTDILKLLQASATQRLLIHVAISGWTSEAKHPSSKPGPPTEVEHRWPLISLAALMTSTDADLVLLAPTLPADDTRLLLAHPQILCAASSYFASLLQSDFAEASTLRQSSPCSLSAHGNAADQNAGQHPGSHDSATPILRLDDISYEQLQTLLFYLYTGVAVFEGRDHVREDDSAKDPADECDCNVYELDRFCEKLPTGAARAMLPWWDGHLQPASAFEMYRIADKYCIDGLRKAALRHISLDISKANLKQDLQEREEITLFDEIKDAYSDFVDKWYAALGHDFDSLIEDVLGLDVSSIAVSDYSSEEDNGSEHGSVVTRYGDEDEEMENEGRHD